MQANKNYFLIFLDIIPKLSASILIFIFANLIRVILTISNQSWYLSLNKPFFILPDKFIEPIWLIVFLITGIAFYIVWQRGFDIKDVKISLYAIIFAVLINLVGLGIFFGLEMILLGFLFSLFLLVILFFAFYRFFKVSKIASLLLVPYIIWIIYLCSLQLGIFLLNI